MAVALATLLFLRNTASPPRLKKGARMARFTKRFSRQAVAEGSAAPVGEDVAARLASYGAGPEAPTAEPQQPEPEAHVMDSAPEHEGPPVTDTMNIATHVQTVLKAAEDAAGRVLEEARAEAADVRAAAERDSSSRIEDAEREVARLRQDAEREHKAALAAAAAARTEAKEEAETIRAEAERDASSFEAIAVSRHEELLKDTALAEERLRRLVGGLREVADHLNSLLGRGIGRADDEEADAHTDEPSLVEALEPQGSTADIGRR